MKNSDIQDAARRLHNSIAKPHRPKWLVAVGHTDHEIVVYPSAA